MARPASANSILKNMKKQSFEPKTPIASDMFLPNHSGNHGNMIANNLTIYGHTKLNTLKVDGTVEAGYETSAEGDYSACFGYQSTASGIRSFAVGRSTIASGDTSFACGMENEVSGTYSFSAGHSNLVSGVSSASFGDDNNVSGHFSCAFGESITVDERSTVGIGGDLKVVGMAGAGGNVKVKGNTKLGDGGTTDYLEINSDGDIKFHGKAGFYPRLLEQDTEPTEGTGATQVDSGEFIVWIDTNDSNKAYFMYNYYGIISKWLRD